MQAVLRRALGSGNAMCEAGKLAAAGLEAVQGELEQIGTSLVRR